MINFKCRKCGKELEDPGAIIWGYPTVTLRGPACFKQEECDKNHLCQECYREVMLFIDEDYIFPM